MKQILLNIFLLFFVVISVFADDIPEKPNPPRLVNDYASILTKEQQNNLEELLVSFAQKTSTQIIVVTVTDVETSMSDFAFRLGEKWGVGQQKDNNGVVIALKPKVGNQKGDVFIATGYGIEHLIPDAIAKRIVEQEMIPMFRMNNYYGGLTDAVKVIMELTVGAYTADNYRQRTAEKGDGVLPGIVFFIFLITFISIFRGKRRQFTTGRSLPFWLLMGMMGSGRSSHSGSWGNFSSGGGSFGGGGFGGFGGGSFGGGGAGGSW